MKRYVFLFIFLFLLFSFSVFCQELPEFLWAVRAGGAGSESGSGIAADSLGNSYITGTYYTAMQFGDIDISPIQMGDVFLAKLGPAGNYAWADGFGTTESERSNSICADFRGNNAIAAKWGSFCAIVQKFDTDGNYTGGFSFGEYTDIAMATDLYRDISGNIYFTGDFSGTVDIGGIVLSSSSSMRDIFIVRIDPANNAVWAKSAGGASGDYSWGITVDRYGYTYITGYFAGTADFGSTQLVSAGGNDIFIAKLGPDGNFRWAKRAGGSGDDTSNGIIVDYFGRVYITGAFSNTADFGSTELTSSGERDIFISMLDNTGAFQWAERAGGSYDDISLDISVVSYGRAYITGYFNDTADFGINQLISEGGRDIFVSKVDAGGSFLWSIRAGGSGDDSSQGIDLSCSGDAYITGSFESAASFGEFDLVSEGNNDIFTARMSSSTDIKAAYRFFNTERGGHLYTISEVERDYILNELPQYSYEGFKFSVYFSQADGTVPVYRFFNNIHGGHLYTISEAERDSLMDLPQWNYEGIKFYVFTGQSPDTVPVYRFFNNVRGGHLYTISEAERNSLMNLPQWNYEGIKFYVYP